MLLKLASLIAHTANNIVSTRWASLNIEFKLQLNFESAVSVTLQLHKIPKTPFRRAAKGLRIFAEL